MWAFTIFSDSMAINNVIRSKPTVNKYATVNAARVAAPAVRFERMSQYVTSPKGLPNFMPSDVASDP